MTRGNSRFDPAIAWRPGSNAMLASEQDGPLKSVSVCEYRPELFAREEACGRHTILSLPAKPGGVSTSIARCDRLLWLQRALPSATLDKIPTTKLSSSILGEPREKSNGDFGDFREKSPRGACAMRIMCGRVAVHESGFFLQGRFLSARLSELYRFNLAGSLP